VNLNAEQSQTACAYCGGNVVRVEAEQQYVEFARSTAGGKYLLAEIARKNGKYAEALSYYNKIIEQDERASEAWLGKGLCSFPRDNLADIPASEVLTSCEAAITFAQHPEAMRKRAAAEIAQLVATCGLQRLSWLTGTKTGGGLREFYRLYGDGKLHIDKWVKALSECRQAYEQMLRWALENDPKSELVAETGISLGRAVLGGGAVEGFNSGEFKRYLDVLRGIDPKTAEECERGFREQDEAARKASAEDEDECDEPEDDPRDDLQPDSAEKSKSGGFFGKLKRLFE
jgi:tetratricopeptide (TPR) repeat protein